MYFASLGFLWGKRISFTEFRWNHMCTNTVGCLTNFIRLTAFYTPDIIDFPGFPLFRRNQFYSHLAIPFSLYRRHRTESYCHFARSHLNLSSISLTCYHTRHWFYFSGVRSVALCDSPIWLSEHCTNY